MPAKAVATVFFMMFPHLPLMKICCKTCIYHNHCSVVKYSRISGKCLRNNREWFRSPHLASPASAAQNYGNTTYPSKCRVKSLLQHGLEDRMYKMTTPSGSACTPI